MTNLLYGVGGNTVLVGFLIACAVALGGTVLALLSLRAPSNLDLAHAYKQAVRAKNWDKVETVKEILKEENPYLLQVLEEWRHNRNG